MQARRRPSAPTSEERLTVAYARVSTEDQAREGVSLEAQETRLRAYITGMGWEIADVIVDAGMSARTMGRPGLQKILTGIRDRSIGRVVVTKMDRLTRSVRERPAGRIQRRRRRPRLHRRAP